MARNSTFAPPRVNLSTFPNACCFFFWEDTDKEKNFFFHAVHTLSVLTFRRDVPRGNRARWRELPQMFLQVPDSLCVNKMQMRVAFSFVGTNSGAVENVLSIIALIS